MCTVTLTYTSLIVVADMAGNRRYECDSEFRELLNAVIWNTIALVPVKLAFSIPTMEVAVLLMILCTQAKPTRISRDLLIIKRILC